MWAERNSSALPPCSPRSRVNTDPTCVVRENVQHLEAKGVAVKRAHSGEELQNPALSGITACDRAASGGMPYERRRPANSSAARGRRGRRRHRLLSASVRWGGSSQSPYWPASKFRLVRRLNGSDFLQAAPGSHRCRRAASRSSRCRRRPRSPWRDSVRIFDAAVADHRATRRARPPRLRGSRCAMARRRPPGRAMEPGGQGERGLQRFEIGCGARLPAAKALTSRRNARRRGAGGTGRGPRLIGAELDANLNPAHNSADEGV